MPTPRRLHPLAARLACLALAGLAALAAAALLLAGAGRAAAAPNALLNVTNTNASGAGSLRWAIEQANLNAGSADTINFQLSGCPCVISLQSPLPQIVGPLNINGPDPKSLAIDGGGAYRIFDIDGAAVLVTGLTLRNGFAATGGGAILATAPLTLSHVYVFSNTSDLPGGAIASQAGVTAIGSVFFNNLSNDAAGGAIFSFGSVTLSGTNFVSNSAASNGGAISGGLVHATQGLFERNHAGGMGGALAVSDVVLTGTDFLTNTAEASGGAVFADLITVRGGLFQGNASPDDYGGAIFAEGALAVWETAFYSNTAGDYGGAVYAAGAAHIAGSRFERNTAEAGGGLYALSAALTDTAFVSNTAAMDGGGGAVMQATLSGGQFVANRAQDAGGLAAEVVTLTGTAFIRNTAEQAGALEARSGGRIHGALFAGNQASEGGGAIAHTDPLTLTASALISNSAAWGGGLHTDGASLANVLLAGNTATAAGHAIYVAAGNTTRLEHVTIAGSDPLTGAAVVASGLELYVTNTIIANYAAGLAQDVGTVYEDFNLFYNVATPLTGAITPGANSFVGDPAFADPAAGDYRIGPASEARDAGVDAGLTTDFDGDARPQDEGFDIGFDEFTLRRLFLPLIRR